jgi:hypothetical protein
MDQRAGFFLFRFREVMAGEGAGDAISGFHGGVFAVAAALLLVLAADFLFRGGPHFLKLVHSIGSHQAAQRSRQSS